MAPLPPNHPGSMKPPRKLHIKSYGCQMNVYDAQRMVDTLAGEGFVETDSADEADLVILNTCHIREKASEKGLFRTRAAAGDEGRGRAQRTADEHRGGRLRRAGGRRRDHPAARLLSMSWSARKAITICRNFWRGRKALAARWKPSFRSRTSSDSCRRRGRTRSAHAASRPLSRCRKGCDKFCTFWRGAVHARRGSLAAGRKKSSTMLRGWPTMGVREITLIGQNVNAYHGRRPGRPDLAFGKLLHRLAEIPGVARLRYSTSHPRDVDDSLIEGTATCPP